MKELEDLREDKELVNSAKAVDEIIEQTREEYFSFFDEIKEYITRMPCLYNFYEIVNIYGPYIKVDKKWIHVFDYIMNKDKENVSRVMKAFYESRDNEYINKKKNDEVNKKINNDFIGSIAEEAFTKYENYDGFGNSFDVASYLFMDEDTHKEMLNEYKDKFDEAVKNMDSSDMYVFTINYFDEFCSFIYGLICDDEDLDF